MRTMVCGVALIAGCLLLGGGAPARGIEAARGEGGGSGTELLPVPEVAAQLKARQMIRKIFEKEYAKTGVADRRAAAPNYLPSRRGGIRRMMRRRGMWP